MNKEKELAYLDALLELTREPAGVRFLFTEEEYASVDVPEWPGRGNYCQLVQAATKGKAFKASLPHLRCRSSARAFGMMDVPEDVKNGSTPFKLGLYPDLATCKDAYSRMPDIDQRSFGFEVAPLSKFEGKPHVVIFITNPYNAMRMVQGYTWSFGGVTDIRMFGNRAMCSECTALAFEENRMSVSLLCSGTRFYCGWDENELAVGLPYGKLTPLIEGLLGTMNATEPLEKKKIIAEKLKEKNLTDYSVDLTKSYYHVYSK